MVCTTRAPNIRPKAQRANWYMDHASHDTIVYIHEKALSSGNYHTTYSAASRGLISILWKPMVCTTGTPNIGPIVQRATWYMDHVSHDTCV